MHRNSCEGLQIVVEELKSQVLSGEDLESEDKEDREGAIDDKMKALSIWASQAISVSDTGVQLGVNLCDF